MAMLLSVSTMQAAAFESEDSEHAALLTEETSDGSGTLTEENSEGENFAEEEKTKRLQRMTVKWVWTLQYRTAARLRKH